MKSLPLLACALNGALIGFALWSGNLLLLVAIPLPLIAIFCFCLAFHYGNK